MSREKSSYQITRYLNSTEKVYVSQLVDFVIKYHWKIKEDFDILKTHGKDSIQYFERKILSVPGLNERISFIESFILLYYFYKRIWEDNLNYTYSNPNNLPFWNILFNRQGIALDILEDFYKNFVSLYPYTYNTEVNNINFIQNLNIFERYLAETDINYFFDRDSSVFNIRSFKPISISTEDTIYLIHRLSRPYKYTRLVTITKHDININEQSVVATILLPIGSFLYDAYLFQSNGDRFIRLIAKFSNTNYYKYADYNLRTNSLSQFQDIDYNIYQHKRVEESFQFWNKYKTTITSNDNCNIIELHITDEDLNYRSTQIPQIIYNPQSDPFTIQYFISDEFVFLLNWTKLTYGIYRIFQNSWETGTLETPQNVKDLKVYLFPDTKNKVKIILNYDCGIRSALKLIEAPDYTIYEESLVLHQTNEIMFDYRLYDEGLILDLLSRPQSGLQEYFGEGLVLIDERFLMISQDYYSEGLILVDLDTGAIIDTCKHLQFLSHIDYLLEIKNYIDTICQKITTFYDSQNFVWFNEFNSNSTKVYEIEVPKNSSHVKRELQRKEYYIDFVKKIFSPQLSLVPAMWSSVNYINSYGTGVHIYESFGKFKILRLHSFMHKEGDITITNSPYDCNSLILEDVINDINRTIRQLVCAYFNRFRDYFQFDNNGSENILTTLTRFNTEIVDINYDIFNSFSNTNRLKDHIILYFMPHIHNQLNELDWQKTLGSLILTLVQYLGTGSSIVSIFGSEWINKLIELILITFLPIHSQIVKGEKRILFDEKTSNTMAIDDYLLIVQNVDLYDHILISEETENTT